MKVYRQAGEQGTDPMWGRVWRLSCGLIIFSRLWLYSLHLYAHKEIHDWKEPLCRSCRVKGFSVYWPEWLLKDHAS